MNEDKHQRPQALPGNVLLDGYIDVPAERIDAVRKALAEHIRLTHLEPGCRYFSVTPDDEIDGRFIVSEIFDDQTAFDAHQARAGASNWAEVTKGIARHYEIRKQ